MPYPYSGLFAIDPESPSNIAANSELTIFDPADTSRSPIPLTDSEGLPIENPLTTNEKAFVGTFYAGLDEVGWHAGGLVGMAQSFKGVRDAAQAAAQSAEATRDLVSGIETSAAAAASAAEAAAKLVAAPADEAIATALNSDESMSGQVLAASIGAKIDGEVPALVAHGMDAAADPTSFIDSIKVLCTFPMYDLDTTRAYMQGFSINKPDNEIYVNIGGGSYGFQRIEIRDLTTGARKSYKELTAEPLSYTEGMPWWKEANGDLKFIVRLGAQATLPSTYQIYNYTTGVLGSPVQINGKVRGDVYGNFYVTNDAYGTTASKFWVYDWQSVKDGAPVLLSTVPISNIGPTFAKVQGVATTGSTHFIVGGSPTEAPTVTAYDWTGQLLFARRWERPDFAKAVNAERPGTITLSNFEWESEGSTNLDGRLVTAHVVGNGTYDEGGYIRTVIIVQHGVQSGSRMAASPMVTPPRDTEWVNATYADGYTYASTARRLQYRVRDGVVYWRGSVKRTAGAFPTGSFIPVTEPMPDVATPTTPQRFEVGEAATSGFALFERTRQLRLYLRTSTGDVVDVNTPPFLNS